MRRVIALMAAALLALTMAGPVAADPIREHFPHVYVTTCEDGTVVPDLNAHAIPGWDIDWAPGDTPWLLMGYTIVVKDVGEFPFPPHPPGLHDSGRLYGPCTITWGDPVFSISDAYFLHK